MAGTAAMCVLTAVLGYFGLSAIGTSRERFDATVDNTVRKLELADKIGLSRTEMVSAQRGIVLAALTKNDSEMQTYKTAFEQNSTAIQSALNEMRPLLVKPEAVTLASSLADEIAQWRPYYEDVARLASAGNADEANKTRTEKTTPIYNRMGADAARLSAIQFETLADEKAAVDAANSGSIWLASMLLGMCALTAAGMILVVRHISLQLRRTAMKLIEGADQVASAAIQVSSASQSLAEGASQQAATIQETSASGKEVSSTARANVDSCHSAADLVSQSQQKFTAANGFLHQMVESMNDVSSSSNKISKIIKVIDEIAFQTNILALNAAVEAARAGEAGKGFAVVAEEVRNLAQRSATAARDTAALIEESIATSHDGRVKVDQVAAAIKDIAAESSRVKTLVDQVNSGSEEQTKGIELIGRSLSQIEQVTQRSAASAEESASAAHQLTSQSAALGIIVKQLIAMVGEGNAEAAVRKPEGEERWAAADPGFGYNSPDHPMANDAMANQDRSEYVR